MGDRVERKFVNEFHIKYSGTYYETNCIQCVLYPKELWITFFKSVHWCMRG